MAYRWRARSRAAAVAALLAAHPAVAWLSAGSGARQPPADQPMSDPPWIAPAWCVDFKGLHFGGLQSLGGKLWYDEAGARHRWTMALDPGFGPGMGLLSVDVLEADVPGLNHNITNGKGSNAVCHADRRLRYVSLFDGLSTSGTWRGRRVVHGEPCDVWDFNSTDGIASVSACLAKDGVPRIYNTTLSPIVSVPQRAFTGVDIFEFGNVSIGPASAGVFDGTDACAHHYPQPLCSDRGVTQLDLYRLHARGEPRRLTGRNIGDALGDTLFLCNMQTKAMWEGRVATHWSVSVNSSFGQYSYCFFTNGQNRCMTESKAVGRESASGVGRGAVQGQCSDNDDFGSWFALPSGGECLPGARVGDAGCTWGEAKALRTIELSCLFERGMREACKEEHGKHPVRRPVEILRAAFASSRVESGGCPDARLPPGIDTDSSDIVTV